MKFKIAVLLMFILFGQERRICFANDFRQTQVLIEIPATPDRVWRLIKDFGSLGWTSADIKIESVSNNKIGDIRTVSNSTGYRVTEKLTAYNEKERSYTYDILKWENSAIGFNYSFPEHIIVGKISVLKLKGKTTVIWNSMIHEKWLSQLADKKEITDFVTLFYRESLVNLKKIVTR